MIWKIVLLLLCVVSLHAEERHIVAFAKNDTAYAIIEIEFHMFGWYNPETDSTYRTTDINYYLTEYFLDADSTFQKLYSQKYDNIFNVIKDFPIKITPKNESWKL